MLPTWQEYVDPQYLPDGLEFKEPSRYLGDESHSILRLWRDRQARGEIPFKFTLVMQKKQPAEAEYPERMFHGLQPPAPEQPITTSRLDAVPEESSGSDTDHGVFIRRRKAANSDDDTGPEGSITGESHMDAVRAEERQLSPDGSHTTLQTVNTRKARISRRIIADESEDSDILHSHPKTPRTVRGIDVGSSPTLAGSSPPQDEPGHGETSWEKGKATGTEGRNIRTRAAVAAAAADAATKLAKKTKAYRKKGKK